MRESLQYLGPDLFTDQEIRWVTDTYPSPIVIPDSAILGEGTSGLETEDTYDGGPIVEEEEKPEAIIPPPAPIRPVHNANDGRKVSSSSIMNYLKRITNDSSGVMRKDGPK